jgi:ElaA protein
MVFQKSFNELSREELVEIFKLRQTVFMIEQQIMEVDIDDHDLKCLHLFIKKDGKIVAYARLITEKDELYIGRIATYPEYRKKGFSNEIIRYLQDRHDVLAISSQDIRIDFYKKLGFKVVGKKYKDAGIWHQKMVYIK